MRLLILLFYFLILCFNSYAIEKKDSLYFNLIGSSKHNFTDKFYYDNYIVEGLELVAQDSIESGLLKLSKGLKLKAEQENIDRVQNYLGIEITTFVHMAVDPSSTLEQRELLLDFFSHLFKYEKEDLERKININWKKADHPLTQLRLQLLWAYVKEDMRLVEKYLTKVLKLNPTLLSANILKANIYYWASSVRQNT